MYVPGIVVQSKASLADQELQIKKMRLNTYQVLKWFIDKNLQDKHCASGSKELSAVVWALFICLT